MHDSQYSSVLLRVQVVPGKFSSHTHYPTYTLHWGPFEMYFFIACLFSIKDTFISNQR